MLRRRLLAPPRASYGRCLALLLLFLAPAPLAAQERDGGGKPRLRWEYFYSQRAYPFGRIPPRALQRALDQYQAQWPEAAAFLFRAPGEIRATTWSPMGPENIPNFFIQSAGRMSSVAPHPSDPNTIYVGAAQGGVWKTTNGGARWTALTDRECSLAMGSIAIDPVNPDLLYAGTGEQHFSGDSYYGCGVLRSADGGATWTQLGAAVFESATTGGARIADVVIDSSTAGSTSSTTLYVASDFGVFKSRDSGATWTRVLEGIATDLVLDPANSSTIYAALGRISGGSDNGVYKSADGGANWTRLGGGFPTSDVGRINLAISRSSPGILYAVVMDARNGSGDDGNLLGVYKTSDAGATWSLLPAPGSSFSCNTQCWYNLVVAVHPADPNRVYVGTVQLYRSTDGGNTFTNILGSVHVDQHGFAFDARDPNIIYVVNDGGVYKSTNGGDSWVSLNTNIAATQFYPGISLHPSDSSMALGGTQDNGTLEFSGTPSWRVVLGADGGYTAIDRATPTTAYAEMQWTPNSSFGGPRRRDGGGNFLRKVSGIDVSEPALFIPPLVMDPSNPQVLYFGTVRLYRTENRAESWTALSPDLTNGGGRISAIAPAPSDSQVIYVGTSNAMVQVTTDGGRSWNLSRQGLPARFVKSIAVDPFDAQTAYVTLSGFQSGHVFRTTNGGASWQDISANLPDMPVNAVVVDSLLAGNIYIGTDLGVFYSRDQGASWEPFNDGFPNVAVFDMVYNARTGHLVAATHGRSMFRVQPPASLIATVRVSPQVDTLGVGQSVQLRATPVDRQGQPTVAPVSWSSSNPQVAAVDASGLVTGRGPGTATIRATAEGASGRATILVVAPATLVVEAGSVAPAAPVFSARGGRLPLLQLQLQVEGREAVDVLALGFNVMGEDPGSRVLLLQDETGDGRADPDEPVLADTAIALTGHPLRVRLAPKLRVSASDSMRVLLAVQFSGGTPNSALFQASFVPEDTRSLGVITGARDRLRQPAAAVASEPVRSTILRAGEVFALSENPVRSDRVVFSFSTRPTVAGVYTLGGRRVLDLLPRMAADGRVDWDLTNEEGGRVAAGVYLVVFEVERKVVREKLLVLRLGAGGEEE